MGNFIAWARSIAVVDGGIWTIVMLLVGGVNNEGKRPSRSDLYLGSLRYRRSTHGWVSAGTQWIVVDSVQVDPGVVYAVTLAASRRL